MKEQNKYFKNATDENTVNPSIDEFAFKRIAIGIFIVIGSLFVFDYILKQFKKT